MLQFGTTYAQIADVTSISERQVRYFLATAKSCG